MSAVREPVLSPVRFMDKPIKEQSIKKKGGARIGAGRPSLIGEKKVTHSFRTTDKQWQTLQAQGGIEWLCAMLDSLADAAAK